MVSQIYKLLPYNIRSAIYTVRRGKPEEFFTVLIKARTPFDYYLFTREQFVLKKAIPVIKQTDSLFIHIPKTAGTSIHQSLYDIDEWSHWDYKSYKQILGETYYNRIFKFSLVRHPVDRLYSAYNYMKKGGMTGQGEYTTHLLKDYPTFKSFVYDLELRPHYWLQFSHFRPQHLFIYNKAGKSQVDYIGKVEDLNNGVFKFLADNLKRETELLHLNKSGKSTRGRDHIQPDLQAIIFHVYKKDFQLLGYRLT